MEYSSKVAQSSSFTLSLCKQNSEETDGPCNTPKSICKIKLVQNIIFLSVLVKKAQFSCIMKYAKMSQVEHVHIPQKQVLISKVRQKKSVSLTLKKESTESAQQVVFKTKRKR